VISPYQYIKVQYWNSEIYMVNDMIVKIHNVI